jgi:hypothetical protein
MIVKSLCLSVVLLSAGAAATPALAQGAIAAATKGTPAKISDAAKVQVKQGYWVECDNVGENCHYVYSFAHTLPGGDPAPGAKAHRLRDLAKVQTKQGYWVECDNVGENCHYVMMFAGAPAQ